MTRSRPRNRPLRFVCARSFILPVLLFKYSCHFFFCFVHYQTAFFPPPRPPPSFISSPLQRTLSSPQWTNPPPQTSLLRRSRSQVSSPCSLSLSLSLSLSYVFFPCIASEPPCDQEMDTAADSVAAPEAPDASASPAADATIADAAPAEPAADPPSQLPEGGSMDEQVDIMDTS